MPAGDAAVLIELESQADPSAAARLAAVIGAAALPRVIDVVPGARTVLVTVEPGSWDTGRLGRELLALGEPTGDEAPRADLLEIPVRYDGEDLADVAAVTGLSVPEVIARHQAGEYEVGWLGFAPGFGYLTGLHHDLAAVPRLDTPRTAVPAGSVAIAGGLAAVYPARSPGGWRLLGRTSVRMWDQDRDPPALLTPGLRVRFRAVDDPPAASRRPTEAPGTSPATLAAANKNRPPGPADRAAVVVQPGPLTTFQDRGRPGLAHLGVPGSGAADRPSFERANALVGNGGSAAGLETTLGRLALEFDCDAVVAVTGAPVPVRIVTPDGAAREEPCGQALAVPAGSALRLGSPRHGLRSYVAVAGGFMPPAVLGSRSADTLSTLGPRPLQAGDWLPLGPPSAGASPPYAGAERTPAGVADRADGPLPAPGGRADVAGGGQPAAELTIIAGPRDDWFTASALETLGQATYHVTAASNRTGLRLSGPPLRRRQPAELPSEGVALGSLQITHDGQPVLLLADHPTTGGYPVIAVVAAADIGQAAQLRPGQPIRFRLIR
jgi:KipI family sensor histidine kinase inhibitor